MREHVYMCARARARPRVNLIPSMRRARLLFIRVAFQTDRVHAALVNYRSFYSEVALINRYLACN
jgi:hypothetical protein